MRYAHGGRSDGEVHSVESMKCLLWITANTFSPVDRASFWLMQQRDPVNVLGELSHLAIQNLVDSTEWMLCTWRKWRNAAECGLRKRVIRGRRENSRIDRTWRSFDRLLVIRYCMSKSLLRGARPNARLTEFARPQRLVLKDANSFCCPTTAGRRPRPSMDTQLSSLGDS